MSKINVIYVDFLRRCRQERLLVDAITGRIGTTSSPPTPPTADKKVNK
jgi:hypothetical protein